MTMERVVTINLNGVAYQLDESAFDALRAYLDRAVASLAANPDKDEIIRDLEQAIADKCRLYLSPSKNVVSQGEMAKILEEMGPVESEGGGEGEGEAPSNDVPPRAEGERPRKRLYRLRDGAVISGVCSGMAAYFDLDANLVRFIFILAAFFTSGAAILVYIVLMFVIPSAHTSEEWAEAHGVPFNAQGVIDDAKRRYSEFEAKGGFRNAWREQRRQWREWRRQHGPFIHVTHGTTSEPHRWSWSAPPAKPAGYATRFFAGLVALVFSIVGAVLTVVFILAVLSLVGTGLVFGYDMPGDLPLWGKILVLCVLFAALVGPVSAIRHASNATVRGAPGYGHDGSHGLVALAVIAIAMWFAWAHIPAAREWMQSLPGALDALFLGLNT
jgi:phage shock protein PspC (stress-responsive transcriptional regulator)